MSNLNKMPIVHSEEVVFRLGLKNEGLNKFQMTNHHANM